MSAPRLRELAALLLLAPCLAVAAVALWRAARVNTLAAGALPLAYAGLCGLGVLAFPAGADPWRSPVAFAGLVAPALVLGAFLLQPRRARLLDRATALLALGAGGAVAAYALRVVLSYQPSTGDVDFFSYVAFARDELDRVAATAPQRLVYFPGTYLFWELALATTHRTLAGLQGWYTGVLLLDGALCAALVWRQTRSAAWALFTAAAQLLLCIDLGASGGITEPIAIAPPLAAILAWSGAPLRGRRGLGLAAVLGAGFGAAIYCKQQAGLVSLGFVALLLLRSRDRTDDLRALAAVPLAAAATLAGLFGAHGGLAALRGGVATLGAYQAWDGFFPNIGASCAAVWPLPLLALAALAVFLVLVVRRQHLAEPWLRCAGLLLACGFAALDQFRRRPFPHYGLLSLPLLVAGTALVGHALWTRLGWWRPRLAAAAAPALLLAATAWLGGRDGDPARASRPGPLPFFSTALDRRPLQEWPYGFAAQRELESIRPLVREGEGAFVICPIRNAVHFLLGTRSPGWPQAYFWGPPGPHDAERAVRDPRVRWVVVRRGFAWELDNYISADAGAAAALALLPGLGYREVLSSADLGVWRR